MPDWLGIPAAGLAWGFALYVWLIAPSTLASRLLVTMLIIDGIAVLSSYDNGSFVDRVIEVGLLNWWRIHQASDWAVMAVYLAFIGVTVQSPLAKIFSGARIRVALLLVGVLLAGAMLPLDLDELKAMQPPLYVAIAIVLTWGFASAVHAWISARDEGSRARAFTFAYGIRDTVWMVTFVGNAVYMSGLLDESQRDRHLVHRGTDVLPRTDSACCGARIGRRHAEHPPHARVRKPPQAAGLRIRSTSGGAQRRDPGAATPGPGQPDTQPGD